MTCKLSPQAAARLVGHETESDRTTLTIRDHIMQGAYRTDDRGRALVPTRSGSVVTILSAEGPEDFPIVGMCDGEVESWSPEGRYLADGDMSGWDLLPPLSEPGR